ncbi:glycosyltransferase family 2 protein [Vallicoccus soli]|uniref:Glycosyltransferase family 2 protein n=1 Tax=Vallicoccus soli TaxID=2339232 RepID=A0A3A3YYG3_9ACTN|nr:glycosyltransferase family 2 protein [Vallicoccus soli]RJK95344.1 glycosyltransferase family 2 protein [Vallicoccus soli]
MTDAPAAAPPVSVVMTVLDEARHLADAVRCALDQDHPGPVEVVVAVGPSTDGTRAIADALAAADPRVRVVDNPDPRGATPAGLNAAIAAARHDVLVRVDGHAMLPRSYVSTAVEALERTGADNVGGVMAAEGTTPFERAVARAMTSRIGVGSAPYHTGGAEGPADSVYLGVFRRSALERVGGFDEAFSRAQDWELNHRIRSTGGTVWFVPALQVAYRPRSSAGALARQYFHYGRWRRVIVRRSPETASARYLAPPAAVVAVAGGAVLGALGLRAGWLAPAGYAAGVLAGSAATARGLEPAAAVRLPLVYATMHGAWGLGFLTSPRALARPVRAGLPAHGRARARGALRR